MPKTILSCFPCIKEIWYKNFCSYLALKIRFFGNIFKCKLCPVLGGSLCDDYLILSKKRETKVVLHASDTHLRCVSHNCGLAQVLRSRRLEQLSFVSRITRRSKNAPPKFLQFLPLNSFRTQFKQGPDLIELRQTWGNGGFDFLEILILYQDFRRIFEGFLGLLWAFLGTNMA